MRKIIPLMVISMILLCLAGAVLVPSVRERLAWHVNETTLKVKYALNPPEKEVFVPQQVGTLAPSATPPPTSTPSPTSINTTISNPTDTPFPTLTPTVPATPLPESVSLKGVRYEDQHGRLNYCAPANLSMALSYWGWDGNRDVVGPVLKPDDKDKNVMPYEMVDYVNDQTDLRAVERVGGDLELLERFLAAGYTVLVEKGVYLRDLTGVVSWMGHYQVITGYDQANSTFLTQDSFITADHPVSYDDLIAGWRAFNYTYIIIYPPDKEVEVMDLLGSDADETANYQNAAVKASNEIYGLAGIDQYFAWFNRGTNLMEMQDFAGAAAAYDEAFAVYPTIPEADRPWRMLWYQTGPYFAYFYSGRYYDTLYLADGTLNAMQGDRNLEESYYWRAMAKAALGDTPGAIQDFRTSLQYHPGFEPALYQLRLLGVENP